MRPYITFDTMKSHSKSLFAVFNHVASSEDFKKIFAIQAFGKSILNVKGAVENHCTGNPVLIRKMEDFANIDDNYAKLVKTMLYNVEYFQDIEIPLRSCDFCVSNKNGETETFFWIKERLEITVDSSNRSFGVAKLMVDSQSDCLLFNNGEDGWTEYGKSSYVGSEFSNKVKTAYDNYLADTQILRD